MNQSVWSEKLRANPVLHRTAILLRSIAAGELGRYSMDTMRVY